MDSLKAEHDKLEKKGNLSKSINDVQKTIDLLAKTRAAIAADPASAQMQLAKLQTPAKQSFDKINEDLKEVHQALGRYGKALDKKFKDKPLPAAENDALSSHPSLVNRAIAMHLLREGQFGVASTFIEEAKTHPPHPEPTAGTPKPHDSEQWEKAFTGGSMDSGALQQQFADMYHILHELKQQQNLTPAIAWSRQHSAQLEARGSNLEFELCRLQYVCLFMGHDHDGSITSPEEGPLRAWAYARSEFGAFQNRYAKEIQQLIGAMAFWQNMVDSPYKRTFYNENAFEEVASSFTREFCSLLGLSADSPLYIAATAGAIALPTLLKLQTIMKEKRTEWTTQNELPVEIPLPPSYQFHSIFVCPVSKEQGTDQNPPMMMPCGHVIAKESLDRISKGARFKCPYCPGESHPRDAKEVLL
ncbi:CTLH/CRA C-terminal to lish motif domain-containing protein [Phyllosticta citriasiana]|uniref:CTLH/CRA C-terminal to lish motif domain-containing protein n=3 Tax=Phyllosticta TaxID=121621 RepID=A0ABR1L7D4_9PEZI